MSDFSELCPLFNTGVYNEVSFHNISMTAIAPTHNALVGVRGLATSPASFKFGRTVIVTKVFQRCDTRPSTKHTILATKQKTSVFCDDCKITGTGQIQGDDAGSE
jgi:hypothetical protein